MIQNIYAKCEAACYGTGTVYFDIQVYNGPGGTFLYQIGSRVKTVQLPIGDIFLLDLELKDIDLNQPNLMVQAQFLTTNCSDYAHVPPVICGPCDLKVENYTVSACTQSTNEYSISIRVNDGVRCQDDVVVEFENGSIQTYTPNANSPQFFSWRNDC